MSYVVQAGLKPAAHFSMLGLEVRATVPGLKAIPNGLMQKSIYKFLSGTIHMKMYF